MQQATWLNKSFLDATCTLHNAVPRRNLKKKKSAFLRKERN